jgi:hypothetical protein
MEKCIIYWPAAILVSAWLPALPLNLACTLLVTSLATVSRNLTNVVPSNSYKAWLFAVRSCYPSPNPKAGEPSLVGCLGLLIQCTHKYPIFLEAVSPVCNLSTHRAVVSVDSLNMGIRYNVYFTYTSSFNSRNLYGRWPLTGRICSVG